MFLCKNDIISKARALDLSGFFASSALMWLHKLNKSTKLGSAAIHSAASFESSREETALNHCAEKHSLLGVAAFFAMNSTRASTQIDANMDSYSWHAADSTPLEGLLFVTLSWEIV